jgi:hypothetical protein
VLAHHGGVGGAGGVHAGQQRAVQALQPGWQESKRNIRAKSSTAGCNGVCALVRQAAPERQGLARENPANHCQPNNQSARRTHPHLVVDPVYLCLALISFLAVVVGEQPSYRVAGSNGRSGAKGGMVGKAPGVSAAWRDAQVTITTPSRFTQGASHLKTPAGAR